jgi:hypothetical protein
LLLRLAGWRRAKGPTFFDLPRDVRDKIYRFVFHDDPAPDLSVGIKPAARLAPASQGSLRHLCQTSSLGSDAKLALKYLTWLGTDRIRQIRHINIWYYCDGYCH